MSILLLAARARQNHQVIPSTGYNSIVSAMAPSLWWKLDETSGVTETDSSSGSSYSGTMSGGTFATSGVSIAAPTGFIGLGRGVNFSALSNGAITTTVTIPTGFLGGLSSQAWSYIAWVTGGSGSQYISSRLNDAAVIYNYSAGNIEFFSNTYTGTNPRTGSQIALANGDTVTPHMIVYRYNPTIPEWSGWKDGVKIFSIAATFGVGTSANTYRANTETTVFGNTTQFDNQLYTRAILDTEITNLWNARNTL